MVLLLHVVPSYIWRSKLYFAVLKTNSSVPICWSEAAFAKLEAPFYILKKPAAYGRGNIIHQERKHQMR